MPDYTWTVVNSIDAIPLEDQNNICKNTVGFPAANHAGYLRSIFSNMLQENEDTPIAILKRDCKAIFALPIVKTKRKKFFFKWTEIGFPFHSHINLIQFPMDALENPQIVSELIELSSKIHTGWSTFVIRNVINANRYKYTGDVAWFNTAESTNISQIVAKKHLRNVQRLKNRLNEDFGDYEFSYNSPSIRTSLDEFIEFEDNTWKGAEGVSIKNDETRGLYSDFANHLSKNIRVFRLSIGEDAIAFALGFQIDHTLYIHKISFSQDYAKYGPGNLLLLEILNMSLMDIEVGNVNLVTRPEWSHRWHPNVSKIYDIEHFNSSFTGRVMKLCMHGWRTNKPAIKSLLRVS